MEQQPKKILKTEKFPQKNTDGDLLRLQQPGVIKHV
jgi:hypothetical protein